MQLIQLWGRAAVRGPVRPRLAATAARTAEPGQPYHHLAEQGRDPARPPIEDTTAFAGKPGLGSPHPLQIERYCPKGLMWACSSGEVRASSWSGRFCQGSRQQVSPELG